MPIIVSGSLAYDYIMDFPDRFKNHILPDQIHILNVCFVVDELRKNFGGCSGNIAYTMKLLGADPIILSAIGNDSMEYIAHLQHTGISTKYITIIRDKTTSSAYITTDADDNQIIAYYNGAGDYSKDLHITDVTENVQLAIIAPTRKTVMMQHARECISKNISFVFDPSHELPAFTREELEEIIGKSMFFIGNDYEMKLAMDKLRWDKKTLLKNIDVLITTLGGKGSLIETEDDAIFVDVCPVKSADDPTGAGDAYRGGFFAAYTKGLDLKICGRVGAVAAAYTVEKYGTQTHTFTIHDFAKRYEGAFGEELHWS